MLLRLESPGLVDGVRCLAQPGGAFWMATPMINGPDGARWMKPGRRGVSCALPYLRRVAETGLEHHLTLLAGQLRIAVDGQRHDLQPGDCLRDRLFGPSAFATPAHSGAHYFLFIV